jgi:hypothetical protein
MNFLNNTNTNRTVQPRRAAIGCLMCALALSAMVLCATGCQRNIVKASPPSVSTPPPTETTPPVAAPTEPQTTTAPPPAAAPEPPPSSAPQPAPQAQATDEQRTNADIAHAEQNLQSAESKELDAAQHDLVEKVRDFLAQAHEAIHAEDWVRASNLAEKARVLSDELAKSL